MENKNTYQGITGIDLLTVLFIGLKLGNVITWSWWWVLSPIWISIGIFLIVAIIALIAEIL